MEESKDGAVFLNKLKIIVSILNIEIIFIINNHFTLTKT